MDSDQRCAVRHTATTGQDRELTAKELRNELIGNTSDAVDEVHFRGFSVENR